MRLYNLLISQDFEKNGVQKKRWHNVGVMGKFDDGEGYWIELPPGLSVSGRLIAKPRREKSNVGDNNRGS